VHILDGAICDDSGVHQGRRTAHEGTTRWTGGHDTPGTRARHAREGGAG
jgi:hypothetical protein